jgi:AcrR family transcriptional regulator
MARKIDPQRRTEILKAARLVFLRDGYGSAKMADIAVQANVAPGTLYLYFDSKETMFGAITDEFFSHLSQVFCDNLNQISDAASVTQLINAVVEVSYQERDLLSLAKQDMLPGKRAFPMRTEFIRQVAESCQQLMDKGIIRQFSPNAFAEIIAGMIFRVVMCCIIFEQGDLAEYKKTAGEMLNLIMFDCTTKPHGEQSLAQGATIRRTSVKR